VTGYLRCEFWDAQAQPRLALPGSNGELKRLQLTAGNGLPLTVCFGHRARRLPPPYHRFVFPYGDGYGLVHPDSTGLRRPTFRYYCSTCRSRLKPLRRRALVYARALHAGRAPVIAGDKSGQRIAAWSGRCRSCGDEFLDTDPNVHRCQRCRNQHRGPAPAKTRSTAPS
jgi:hypothetical protein